SHCRLSSRSRIDSQAARCRDGFCPKYSQSLDWNCSASLNVTIPLTSPPSRGRCKRGPQHQEGFAKMTSTRERFLHLEDLLNKRKYPRRILFTVFLSSLASVTLAAAQERIVKVAIPAVNMSVISFSAAVDRGFYRDEGLRVELILMPAPIAS